MASGISDGMSGASEFWFAGYSPAHLLPIYLDILAIKYDFSSRNQSMGAKTMMVEPFVIDNESEADGYLGCLFEKHEYRSMDEINMRAQKLIKDDDLKNYFINKAKEILKAYGHEME